MTLNLLAYLFPSLCRRKVRFFFHFPNIKYHSIESAFPKLHRVLLLCVNRRRQSCTLNYDDLRVKWCQKTYQFLEWAHSLEPGTMFFNSDNRVAWQEQLCQIYLIWLYNHKLWNLNLIPKISEILRSVLSIICDLSGIKMNGNWGPCV